jgi:ribulose-phosphate 3-epimerase
MKAGVSLNPATPIDVLKYILQDLDMVLIMTVNPGFGGQTMIPGTLKKVQELRTLADQLGIMLDIEVDGGITLDNVDQAIHAGANVIVSGTSVFKGDIAKNISDFRQVFLRCSGQA